MYRLNSEIPLKEQIHGTRLYVTKLVVTLREQHKFRGRVVVEDGVNAQEETHPWGATRTLDKKWKVTGDGARLSNGNRIRSPDTYPFSLVKNVNDGIRAIISAWLESNGNKISDVQAEPLVKAAALNASRPPTAAMLAPAVKTPQPALPARTAGSKIPETVEVLLSEVQPFAGQPRDEILDDDIDGMSESIIQEDQKQLIIVTPLTGVPGKRWKLVDGERRYRGALKAGKQTLLAIVRYYANEEEMFWDSFIMNMNRRGHTPIQNSRGIARAMRLGKTVAQIAKAMDYSVQNIYHLLDLQRLDESLQRQMYKSIAKSERLGYPSAKILSRIPDKAAQVRIWATASREKTPALKKLKVEELAEPLLVSSPVVFRKTKPGDNAVRMVRNLRTMESILKVFERAGDIDLLALLAYNGAGKDRLGSLGKVRQTATQWVALEKRLTALAPK